MKSKIKELKKITPEKKDIELNYIPLDEPINWDDIFGLSKPANNATYNTGALADLDTVGTSLIDNLAITAAKLAAAAVETDKVKDDAITTGKIAAGAVTATEINVATLSAISANIGTVTAGTITGLTIQSSASASTGVKLTSGGLAIYGQTLTFWSGGDATILYASGASLRCEGGLITDGAAQLYSLRIDQTAAAGTITPTHTFTISLNGTNYKVPCVAA